MRWFSRLLSLFSKKKQQPCAPDPEPEQKIRPAAQPIPAPMPETADQPEIKPAPKTQPEPESEPEPESAAQPKPESEKVLSLDERRKKLIAHCIGELCKQLESMPEKEMRNPIGVGFAYAGTENIGILRVEPDLLNSSNHRMILQCMRRGYDLCVSNYMCKGSREEILAYLQNSDTLEEFTAAMVGLSSSVDDHMD